MSYNTAIRYLQTKYAIGSISYTSGFQDRLRRARNSREREDMVANATDRDKIIHLNDLRTIEGVDHDDLEVYLLVGQYHYSRSVDKELTRKLVDMNLLKDLEV